MPGGYANYWWLDWLTQRSRHFIQLSIALAYSGKASTYLRNPVAAAAVNAWYPTYQQNRIRNLATLLLALRDADLRAEAVHVRCPVLVIAGTDPVVPVAQAHWLAAHAIALYPHSRQLNVLA